MAELRASQASLVLNVDRRSGTRLTELARRAGVTKQAMMVVVDELEVRGFVRRTPDPDDGRAKVVRLTARGRTLGAECRRAVAAVELGRGEHSAGDATRDCGRRSTSSSRARRRPRERPQPRRADRSARNRSRGISGASPVTRSASTSPMSGVNLKP